MSIFTEFPETQHGILPDGTVIRACKKTVEFVATQTALVNEQDKRIEQLEAALRGSLNFIENTESELGITLSCGDIARAALGEKKDG